MSKMIGHKKKKDNSKPPKIVKEKSDKEIEDDLEESDDQLSIVNGNKRKNPDDHDDDDSSIKKKGKVDKHFFKQPTAEELSELRETENLFHSNLFRLQIEEVLEAVKIKDKYKKLFSTWFEQFKSHVNALKSKKEFEVYQNKNFFQLKFTITTNIFSSLQTMHFLTNAISRFQSKNYLMTV